MKHVELLVIFGLGLALGQRPAYSSDKEMQRAHFIAAPLEMSSFYKGNLHTHSRRSDGDGPTRSVIQWYREHGYNFLAMTEHHKLTPPEMFRDLETSSFVLVPAEEATYNIHYSHQDGGYLPVHANGFCMTGEIPDPEIYSNAPSREVRRVLTSALQRLNSLSTVVQVNHPNFVRALRSGDILASTEEGSSFLLEVANQHPGVYNSGVFDGRKVRESTEEIWDKLLIEHRTVFGTATDDMHHFYRTMATVDHHQRLKKHGALGGQGWVEVAATTLEPNSICQALKDGHFYSSNGVKISNVKVKTGRLSIEIGESGAPGEYVTEFIGASQGKVKTLASQQGPTPNYELRGDELYVRAVVTRSDGKKAWIQPLFVSTK